MVILQTKQAKIYLSYLVRHHLDFFSSVSLLFGSDHFETHLDAAETDLGQIPKKKTSACSFSVLRSKPTMTTTTLKARPTFSF